MTLLLLLLLLLRQAPASARSVLDRRAAPPKPDEDVISWRDGGGQPYRSARAPGEFGAAASASTGCA